MYGELNSRSKISMKIENIEKGYINIEEVTNVQFQWYNCLIKLTDEMFSRQLDTKQYA